MKTLIGICEPNRLGFGYQIDMDYKGKDDQWTGIEFSWNGSEESFIKKCEELGLDVVWS